MVNNKIVYHHRALLLEILRSAASPVSPLTLAEELGVSRVALWKQLKKLQEIGYPIQKEKKGYLFVPEKDPDLLCPWELPPYAPHIHWFRETTSTMEVAKKQGFPDAEKNHEEKPQYYTAEFQTKGRGRFEREWDSSRGGLYLTIVLPRKVPLSIIGRYPLLVAAVLAETLETGLSISDSHGTCTRVALKWPNDILWKNKKVGGILLDFIAEGDYAVSLNLGIGINFKNHPEVPGSISLSKALGNRLPSRREFLSRYLQRLEPSLQDPFLQDALPRWKRYTCTLGKPVQISSPAGNATGFPKVLGIAEDLTPGGGLLVRTSSGDTFVANHEDCVHCRAPRHRTRNGNPKNS